MLSLYRALLALRRREAALSLGPIAAVAAGGEVLRYERHDPQDGRRLLVALNFGGAEQALERWPARRCSRPMAISATRRGCGRMRGWWSRSTEGVQRRRRAGVRF